MKFFNKKTVIVILIATVLFSIAPKPTLAAGPSFETNPLVWIANQITAAATKLGASAAVATKIQQALEWAFKLATEILKRQLLNSITNQTVKWIQGGGNPQFITNWPGFFRDAVDQAGGKFLKTAIGSQICSPFRDTLKFALEPVPTFNDRTTCTLDTIANNFNNTIGYFKSGNWIAWNQMVSNPQNNVYGAYVMAWDQYEIEKSAAAQAAAAEVQAGKGFLDVKNCLEWDTPTVNKCLDAGGNYEECEKAGCTKWETITPGDTVGAAVAKVVGSNIDFIVNANDLKGYIATIANALINKMFQKGVGLLHMNTTSSSSGSITEGGGGTTHPPDVKTQCGQFSGDAKAYNACIDAMSKCLPFWNTGVYDDCMANMENGADIEEFKTKYASTQCDRFRGTETYDSCITTLQSDPNIEKFMKDYASTQCAQFLGTQAYKDCLTDMQSSIIDIREFEKKYLLYLINQTQDNQIQILENLQAGIFALNESITTLNQLFIEGNKNPGWVANTATRVSVTIQIVKIQSYQTNQNIQALYEEIQKIEAITDLSQIPAIWTELAAGGPALWAHLTAKPLTLQNIDVSSAIQDANQRAEDLNTWYKELNPSP